LPAAVGISRRRRPSNAGSTPAAPINHPPSPPTPCGCGRRAPPRSTGPSTCTAWAMARHAERRVARSTVLRILGPSNPEPVAVTVGQAWPRLVCRRLWRAGFRSGPRGSLPRKTFTGGSLASATTTASTTQRWGLRVQNWYTGLSEALTDAAGHDTDACRAVAETDVAIRVRLAHGSLHQLDRAEPHPGSSPGSSSPRVAEDDVRATNLTSPPCPERPTSSEGPSVHPGLGGARGAAPKTFRPATPSHPERQLRTSDHLLRTLLTHGGVPLPNRLLSPLTRTAGCQLGTLSPTRATAARTVLEP
jgi:hypothetical protein